MKRKSFTLIEILVALIILSILASLSVAAYQKTVDTNNERICAENLKVLQAAIDIYTVENDLLPLELSQLTPRQIHLAYSRVIGERKENFLSIAFRKMFSTEVALAGTQGQLFKRRYLGGKKKLFHDPAAGTYPGEPSSCNNIYCGSYLFNFTDGVTVELNATTNKRKLKKDSNAALIRDSGARHKGKHRIGTETYSLGITPYGRVGKESGGDVSP